MGRILTDTMTSGRDAIFVVSLLAVLAYTKWHYWWRTGWGLTRMSLLLSLAALELDHVLIQVTRIDADFDSIGDDTVSWLGVIAIAGVLASLAYMLCRIVTFNLRRVRDPYFTVMQGRQHIERTPGADRDEIEKLVSRWDEIHTYQRTPLR